MTAPIVVVRSHPAVCICGGLRLMQAAAPGQPGNVCPVDCPHCCPPYLPLVVLPKRGESR